MFSVKEALKIQEKKNSIKKETYKAVLQTLLAKIKIAVENGKSYTFVNVPVFIVGYPVYDRKKATDYMSRQLNNLGYTTTKYTEFDIYVTWKKEKNTRSIKEKEQFPELPPFINLRKFAQKINNDNI